MRYVLALLAVFFLASCMTPSSYEVIARDLDTVWAIDFLPDDTLIFTQRPGVVSVIEEGVVREVGRINSTEISESGLLGLAVDPQFEENRFIYLYYTYESQEGVRNRLSRFTLEEELVEERVLLDSIPAARYHDGGRVEFGPDGKLYVTVGDATDPSTAQDISSLAGKILRLNPDGSIPEDNPFGNYVWSYGHRNPQGLAWDGEVMYASEHGPQRNDEVNVIVKGGDYGWPQECVDEGDFTQPIRCFTEFTLAPGGIAIDDGEIYVAGLRGAQVRVLGDEEYELIGDIGRVREAVIHDDALYVGTSNRDGRGVPRPHDDKIIRVKI